MKRDMFFWPADLPKVKYCSENNKRLIHLSTCEVYWKTIGSYLPKYSPLRQCKIMGNLFCLYQVDQSTVAIKEAFGKFDDVLEPGCHCVPWGFGKQIAGLLTLRLQQLDVKCETKTKVLLLRTCFIGKQQSWGLLIVHTLVGCSLFQSIFLLTIHSNPQRLHLGRRYSIQTSTTMELPLKWKLVESLKKELPERRSVDLESNPLHGPLKSNFSSPSVESAGI